MNLSLLILFPLITAVIILLMRNGKQVKWVSFTGAALQLVLAFVLLFLYNQQRRDGNTTQMLFETQYNWFPSWNISFHLGVDGISVAMILLTAFVVIAGVLVSWNVTKNDKGVLFPAYFIEPRCLWFLYFTRSFYPVFLFRDCSNSKIPAHRYLGKR